MKSILVLTLAIGLFTAGCCKHDHDDEPQPCACYEIYAPVCGSDGKTYPNDCYALCAGVTYTDGPCALTVQATVRDHGNPAADGCGWLLEVANGDAVSLYYPENLPDQFKEDGLDVSVEFQNKLENFTCGLAANFHYPVVTIIEISTL